MRAGETQYPVGARVQVVSIADSDPDEAVGVVGTVGTLTHPFGDAVAMGAILGVWVEQRGNVPPGAVFPDSRVSLYRGDRIRFVDTGKNVTL